MSFFTPRLNIEKPDLGDNTWKGALDALTDQLDKVAVQYLTFRGVGEPELGDILHDGFRFDESVTITKISLFAMEGPTGAAWIVDITKNGTPLSKTASIASGQQAGSANIAGVQFASTEDFGLKVVQVGSTIPGAEIGIKIHYHVAPLP